MPGPQYKAVQYAPTNSQSFTKLSMAQAAQQSYLCFALKLDANSMVTPVNPGLSYPSQVV